MYLQRHALEREHSSAQTEHNENRRVCDQQPFDNGGKELKAPKHRGSVVVSLTGISWHTISQRDVIHLLPGLHRESLKQMSVGKRIHVPLPHSRRNNYRRVESITPYHSRLPLRAAPSLPETPGMPPLLSRRVTPACPILPSLSLKLNHHRRQS